MTVPAYDSTADPFGSTLPDRSSAPAGRAVCANCGKTHPNLADAVECAYRDANQRGVPADAPANVEYEHAYISQEDYGLRQPPSASPAELRWLQILEASPGYCTDDEGDRRALARLLAAAPVALRPVELEAIIAISIQGFVESMAAGGMQPNIYSRGLQSRLAQHLRGNLWAALQQRGILP